MAEMTQSQPLTQASPEELAAAIAELEQYRERLVNDTMDMAKRAKVMKAQAQSNLEPNLARIDSMLAALRQQQADMVNSQQS